MLIGVSGFSTLYGSKWVATQRAVSIVARFSYKFQYPLRVEVGCNPHGLAWWLFLFRFQYPLRVEVGCNHMRAREIQVRETFQYPLRVEVGCNKSALNDADCQNHVSVPSTGRSGLQPRFLTASQVIYDLCKKTAALKSVFWTKFLRCYLRKSITRVSLSCQVSQLGNRQKRRGS